jgi:hypothetical protein
MIFDVSVQWSAYGQAAPSAIRENASSPGEVGLLNADQKDELN